MTSPGHCNLSKGIAIDPESDTVTFHLTAPDPDFLYKLALPIADAVPATTPLRARLPLPATGPYEIAKVDAKQAEIELVRNPRFRVWSAAAQPEGFPDQIVERFGYTAKSAVEAVERGTADITGDNTANQPWAPSLASMLQTRYSSQLHSAPMPGTVALWLNTRLPPFNNLRVRQALNYAVDRNRLVALAGGPDVAQVSCQVLPPNVGGFRRYCPYTLQPNPAGTYNGPDLAKAQRLVAASGTEGQPVTVWFYNIPIGRADGAYIVSVLRSLGYDAHLRLVPQVGSTWQPDRQAGIGGWAEDYPSANDFFSTQFACNAYDPAQPGQNSNTSGFCDPHVDAEIARASEFQASDPPAASRLWTKIDRQITLRAPWVVIRSALETDFVSRRTGNYTYCYLDGEDRHDGSVPRPALVAFRGTLSPPFPQGGAPNRTPRRQCWAAVASRRRRRRISFAALTCCDPDDYASPRELEPKRRGRHRARDGRRHRARPPIRERSWPAPGSTATSAGSSSTLGCSMRRWTIGRRCSSA